ncbi:MAG: Spy/CpxP family protein refolding chaperone [Pyrinomonadaceae bacterium]
MKTTIGNSSKFTGLVFAVLLSSIALLGIATVAAGQQNPSAPPQTQNPQMNLQGDPIRQLNLSAEQVEKIRAIREQNKDERFALNQRLRRAQRALDEAIQADNSSEALIEQRAHDLAEAQADATRMRAITEIRIRRVLTPEQLIKLRTLRQQAQTLREEQRLQGNNQIRPRDGFQRRPDAQRNGNLRPNQVPRARPGTLRQRQQP